MKKIVVLLIAVFLLTSLVACAAPFAGTKEAAEAVSGEAAASINESTGDAGLTGLPNTDLPDSGRKLTQSAYFEIHTKQYDADYTKIMQLMERENGYVANEETSAYSSQSGRNYGRNSRLSLRVPADRLNAFMDGISGIGELIGKNKTTEDLTSQYYDTTARIDMLELRKERLMGYLESATKAEDIIAFEKELSDVLYELDQLQGNKRQLDQLVDYATVDVTLIELITPETIGKDGQPLGDRASEAFSMSMTGVGEFLDGMAVFFAAAVPVLLLLAVFGVIAWVIVWLVRRIRARVAISRLAKQAGEGTKPENKTQK